MRRGEGPAATHRWRGVQGILGGLGTGRRVPRVRFFGHSVGRVGPHICGLRESCGVLLRLSAVKMLSAISHGYSSHTAFRLGPGKSPLKPKTGLSGPPGLRESFGVLLRLSGVKMLSAISHVYSSHTAFRLGPRKSPLKPKTGLSGPPGQFHSELVFAGAHTFAGQNAVRDSHVHSLHTAFQLGPRKSPLKPKTGLSGPPGQSAGR